MSVRFIARLLVEVRQMRELRAYQPHLVLLQAVSDFQFSLPERASAVALFRAAESDRGARFLEPLGKPFCTTLCSYVYCEAVLCFCFWLFIVRLHVNTLKVDINHKNCRIGGLGAVL